MLVGFTTEANQRVGWRLSLVCMRFLWYAVHLDTERRLHASVDGPGTGLRQHLTDWVALRVETLRVSWHLQRPCAVIEAM